MIDLYTSATPNGQKIHMMLEETGLAYNEHWVDLEKGEQFDPKFLAISPNNKIPALADDDGPDGERRSRSSNRARSCSIWRRRPGGSCPQEPRARLEVMQWLMWQMASFGPMLGQAHHFRAYAPEKIDYAYDRYTNEARRLYRVLDRRLGEAEYVAGDYSIADMAIFPWCRLHGRQGQKLEDHPNVLRWFGNDRRAARRRARHGTPHRHRR